MRALVARSWFAPFEQFGGASIAKCHLRMFANLKSVASSHLYQPYYVFGHVVLPHYPYVFHSDCSVKSQVEMSNAFSLRKELWNDSASYLDQVQCVNSLLGEVLDTIIREDPTAWIVIHSDHGPDIPRLPEVARISARLANFIAFRAPEGEQFNVNVHSPVGILQRILNQITKSNKQIIERYFYIPDEKSGSIHSWKEFTVEELRRGIEGS